MYIKPSAAIRQNYNDIAELCKTTGEPVYLTKNGEGDLVVMDIEAFTHREKMLKLREELLAVEEDRLHGAVDHSVDEVAAMMEVAIQEVRVVVSKRAAQQLVEHAAFAARLDEKLAHKLVSDFRQAAVSLERFPFRNSVLRSEVFTVEKYRKLIFDKYHILLYQVKDQVVYVEYVIDGRQDYQWLLTP